MGTIITFEIWHDLEEGRSYVEEFLDGLGDADALRVLDILENDFSILGFANLIVENKMREIEGREGLYYVRVNIKRDRRIRLFGCLIGHTMYLVHGAEKHPLRELSKGHYDTAEQRIKKIRSENKN